MIDPPSLAARLADLDEDARHLLIDQLTDDEAEAILYDWLFWSREDQRPPPGTWLFWMLLAGRGAGKTRTGAEFIRDRVRSGKARRLTFVAPTAADVRDLMVEGESGILAVSPPNERPFYEPSKRRLTWPNGARARLRTADKPDGLRGLQHDTVWCEELASWRYPETFDHVKLGLRIGEPCGVITTTPRPTKLIKELLKNNEVVVTHATTYDNAENLAPAFFRAIVSKYEGSRLGLQEIHAKVLEDVEGALWKREVIEAHRIQLRSDAPESYRRIVVAIDPSWGTKGDTVGIGAAALGFDGHAYVLDDKSGLMTPETWGTTAVELYDQLQADKIIAESNFAAEQVKLVMQLVGQQLGRTIPVELVSASRGKQVRAEPVVALYEQGRVHHVGTLALLEDEMCNWIPGESDFSPGRVDALVWAITELMLDPRKGPASMRRPKGSVPKTPTTRTRRATAATLLPTMRPGRTSR